MSIADALKKRRSYYEINKELPVSEEAVIELVKEVTELVPDAFNMKSSRVVVALGDKQNELWDAVYDAFGGKVAREKIDGFRAGAGTILYFYDDQVVAGLQEKFPRYSENFPLWAMQASAMLQLSIWSSLRELEIGASLQHYNPVIDREVKELFDLPESYILVAQMPFGGIAGEPPIKEGEEIEKRLKIFR